MQIIKIITKGDWTLEHSWVIDDFGLKKSLMQISKVDDKTHIRNVAIRVHGTSLYNGVTQAAAAKLTGQSLQSLQKTTID